MREKYTYQTCVMITEKTGEKIRKAAKDYNTSIAEIIRECIDKELPRLVDRENKRRQYHEKHVNIDTD